MVFYRKYRPQTIDDLDSAAVRDKLQALFSKQGGGLPHAFLFTGPKGLGKTSTARIIAKAINCERKNQESGIRNHGDKTIKKTSKNPDSSFIIPDSESIEPCNECLQCISITNGTNMDILEIDAASNRGIDEIRDLKEKIRLSPLSAKKKIYIIDEVHMLTTEAFNALLKTLEEPPDHAVFILCTTEAHKLPSTIISRCTHINFSLATPEELVRSFKRIVKGENIAIDEEALGMLASLSEGGFRDGTKILEEIVLLANGQKITKQVIEDRYKVASITNFVTDFLEALKKRNAKESLQLVAQLVEQGVNMKYVIEQLISTLHVLMLGRIGVNNQPAPSDFTLEEIKELVQLLSKAYADMKYAVLLQLPLELAIIEYCEIKAEEKEDVPRGVGAEEKRIIVLNEDEEGEVTVSSLRKQVGAIKKIKALYGDNAAKTSDEKRPPQKITPDIELQHVPANGEITKEWLDMLWKHIIAEVKVHNHTVAGLLRSCSIKLYDKKQLVIVAAYPFHKERLDDLKTRDTLVKVCKTLTGNEVTIEVELKK